MDANAAPKHLRGNDSEQWKLECFAQWLLDNKSRKQIVSILERHGDKLRDELNRQKNANRH